MVVETALIVVGLLGGMVLLARMTELPPRSKATAVRPRDISIVVPARNEEASLPRLLASIEALENRPGEIIVVDDASTDRTAAIARSHGAKVVAAPQPPVGWLGKPWACWTGARIACGTHILFLDADVVLGSTALRRIGADAGRGLLTVQPFHQTGRPYESLSSCFNLVSLMGSGAFAAVRPGGHPIAFGPCLFTSRIDYFAIDGHRSVRASIVEDAALAARYTAHDLPVRHRIGGDAVTYRMYPDGVRSLIDGWTRTLAAGARSANMLPVAVAVLWVAACIGVVANAITWMVSGGSGATALALYALVAVSTWRLLSRVGSFRWWTWALFPVPLACFVMVFARSLWCTFVRRELVWRARTVSLRNQHPLKEVSE